VRLRRAFLVAFGARYYPAARDVLVPAARGHFFPGLPEATTSRAAGQPTTRL